MCEEHSVLLEARHLTKRYRDSGGANPFRPAVTQAVQDVSLSLRQGETFGIVGESGCGKSTVARLLTRLERPTAGEIYFHGQRIDNLPEGALRPLRPKLQMVFQDSGSSLNPRKRVVDIIKEPMLYHRAVAPRDADARIAELLTLVGLSPDMARRYPHEFSGGQRQRICIARALSLSPELIVLDEPVSALDVSVQAQILNLLRDLQAQLKLTYLFIGHGLGAVRYVSHRIAVMYMGAIVESGDAEALFDRPAHPYTRALLDAAPVADYSLRQRQRVVLSGEVDAPHPGGCPLYGRCPHADAGCRAASPALRPVPGEPDRLAACTRALGASPQVLPQGASA